MSAVVATAAVLWTVVLPGTAGVGRLGRDYRWQDAGRAADIQEWIDADLFQPMHAASRRLRTVLSPLTPPKGTVSDENGQLPGRDELATVAEGLHIVDGTIRPRSYLVDNPNVFAGRRRPRGALLDRHGTPLALSLNGRRHYPYGAALFHPLGYAGNLARPVGVESAVRPYLRRACR